MYRKSERNERIDDGGSWRCGGPPRADKGAGVAGSQTVQAHEFVNEINIICETERLEYSTKTAPPKHVSISQLTQHHITWTPTTLTMAASASVLPLLQTRAVAMVAMPITTVLATMEAGTWQDNGLRTNRFG